MERLVGLFVVVVVPCPDRSPPTLGSPGRRGSCAPNRCPVTVATSGGPHSSPRPADTTPDPIAVTPSGSLSFLSFLLPNVRAHPRARTRPPARVGWSAMLGSSSSSSGSCLVVIVRAADARFAMSAGEFRSESSPPPRRLSAGLMVRHGPPTLHRTRSAVTPFGSLSFLSLLLPNFIWVEGANCRSAARSATARVRNHPPLAGIIAAI